MVTKSFKVYKMGKAIGLSTNSDHGKEFAIDKGNYALVNVKNSKGSKSFISRFNSTITIKTVIKKELDIKPGDAISVSIEKAVNQNRPMEIFKNSKIDLLSLIPERTFLEYEIVASTFMKDDEEWLRVWYCHPTGSARQVELKRYVDMRSFGRLLGQLQAEGTKYSDVKKQTLSFANKLVQEHTEFIEALVSMGLDVNYVEMVARFNPSKCRSDFAANELNKIIKGSGISNVRIRPYLSQKGKLAFVTTIRSSILAEIVLSSMDTIRNIVANQKFDQNSRVLGETFLSKLLTGDGTIDIHRGDYSYPRVQIKIVDQKLDYLKDYDSILKNFGFKSRIDEKNITVRSTCSFENLLFLYKIRAFENTNNWKKLAIVIQLTLTGRRVGTYNRFISLSKLEKFNPSDISDQFEISLDMAKDWIKNGIRLGMIEEQGNYYILTEKSENIVSFLSSFKEEHSGLASENSKLWDSLDSIKVRGRLVATS